MKTGKNKLTESKKFSHKEYRIKFPNAFASITLIVLSALIAPPNQLQCLKNKTMVYRKSLLLITTLIAMLTIALLAAMQLKLNLNIHI